MAFLLLNFPSTGTRCSRPLALRRLADGALKMVWGTHRGEGGIKMYARMLNVEGGGVHGWVVLPSRSFFFFLVPKRFFLHSGHSTPKPSSFNLLYILVLNPGRERSDNKDVVCPRERLELKVVTDEGRQTHRPHFQCSLSLSLSFSKKIFW